MVTELFGDFSHSYRVRLWLWVDIRSRIDDVSFGFRDWYSVLHSTVLCSCLTLWCISTESARQRAGSDSVSYTFIRLRQRQSRIYLNLCEFLESQWNHESWNRLKDSHLCYIEYLKGHLRALHGVALAKDTWSHRAGGKHNCRYIAGTIWLPCKLSHRQQFLERSISVSWPGKGKFFSLLFTVLLFLEE